MLPPNADHGLLILEVSISHITTHHGLYDFLWTSKQPIAETSIRQHTALTTDRNAPGRIRTHNHSRGMAADPLLRSRGHWDWLIE